MDVIVILVLAGLVALAVGLLAWSSQKRDNGQRGATPGKGYHELKSDYQSGVGGGNVKTWKIPRDPQEYSKLFIPKENRK